jgi:hypothetical protein
MEDPMQQSTDIGFAIHKKAKRGAKCHVIRDKLTRERHLLFFCRSSSSHLFMKE